MKFTDKFIQSLKASDRIQDIREGKGFGIRVTPGGVKTWFFIYRFDGKRRFMNLGHYPGVTLTEANKRYRAAFDLHEQGNDPLALSDLAQDERRKAPTIADLVDDYITRYAKRFKKSWEEDKRILDKEVLPVWGKRKAADIRKRDILELLDKIVVRPAPVMANNTFKIIRKMFNWSVEQDILTASPAFSVKLPSPKVDRDRVLSSDEIKTLWNALDTAAVSDAGKRALRLVMVTAQRPGEVTGMHTNEIDGDWWTVPADRAKNGKAHRVYLTATAQEIINQAIAQVKQDRELSADTEYSGFIFPCPHIAKEKPMERHALSRGLARNFAWPITDAKGKPLYDKDGKPATENRLKIDHFTPHDLRRTAATFMSQNGCMDEVIDAVLNHVKQGIIKVYNQNKYDIEKQAALEEWEIKLNCILTATEYRNRQQREEDKKALEELAEKKNNGGNVISIKSGKRKAA